MSLTCREWHPHLCVLFCGSGVASTEAVPKKILELMMVDGLTRENVASHLQKYRLYLKRVQGVDGSGNHHGHQPAPNPKSSSKTNNAGVMQAVQQQQDPQQLQQQPSMDMQQQPQPQQQQAGPAAPAQQQQQQQPPQQQQMPGVVPGMGAGSSLGMMGPFGPQSMPAMAMNPMAAINPMASMMAGLGQMAMPGMPGMPHDQRKDTVASKDTCYILECQAVMCRILAYSAAC